MNQSTATEPAIEAMRQRLAAQPCFSPWLDVTQDRITAFGGITLDFDPDHIDPVQAAGRQFGIAVNQGFLTLSLLTYFLESAKAIPSHRSHMNYGLDRVRWTAPVPVGSRIRGRFDLADVAPKEDGVYLITFDVTVEIEGQQKPAMVARWLARVQM